VAKADWPGCKGIPSRAKASAASNKARNRGALLAALDTCPDTELLVEPEVFGLPRLHRVLQLKVELLQSERNKLM
jgi:hypothetical protein